MPMKEDSNDLDQENPEEIVDEIVSLYDSIQSTFIQGATLAGQEKERYKSIRPAWENLSKTSTFDPDEAKVYSSGVYILKAYRNELIDFEENIPKEINRFQGLLSSSDLTASTTSGTSVILGHEDVFPRGEVTLPSIERYNATKAKLSQLNPSLSATYSSIREILYGTQEDPERGALFLSRQFFDHFFAILAPDELVIVSNHWAPHDYLDNPNTITRKDRIIFAANSYVKCIFRRKNPLIPKNSRPLRRANKTGQMIIH